MPSPDTGANSSRLMMVKPCRKLESEEREDGRCVVLRPKFGGGRTGRWLATLVHDPHYRIQLDEVGTFVWKSCDGQTPLVGIRRRFGSHVEPADKRLLAFVGQMRRAGLLCWASSEKSQTEGAQEIRGFRKLVKA
jgi:hypothetical protein